MSYTVICKKSEEAGKPPLSTGVAAQLSEEAVVVAHLLQFDGLAAPNPGEATAGAVIYLQAQQTLPAQQQQQQKQPLIERGEYIGHATNNYAEYTALLIGLQAAAEEGIKALLIEGDSQLVINQVCGTWKINNAELKSIHTKIRALVANKFEYVAIRHVRREYNRAADKITNDVLATKESFHTVYAYSN
jgi:ribonuclease HI